MKRVLSILLVLSAGVVCNALGQQEYQSRFEGSDGSGRANLNLPASDSVEESPGPRRYSVSEVTPPDPWRTRYELGPGDVLNLRLQGNEDSARDKVPVGPDGTISFMQARRISANGLTIPELAKKVESELANYHRDPRVVITPVAVGSKRYTILGQVKANGTYPLTRPMTLLEAIANSGGAEIGLRATTGPSAGGIVGGGEKVGLVDFESSFVLRAGKMLDVSLSDLYLRGDISQNIQIESGDYIYLASNLLNEIYVFGAVLGQGVIPFQHELTVMGVITASGGYDPFAWKDRILIVRGSLTHPVYLVVDTKEILRGKAPDVPVKPGDIVYVHTRPWKFGEQLAEAAITGLISGYAYRLADKDNN